MKTVPVKNFLHVSMRSLHDLAYFGEQLYLRVQLNYQQKQKQSEIIKDVL